jgi:hypothetical protein
VIEATAEESALSRAITAASRLAAWEPPQFYESLSEQRSRALRSFLGGASSELNKRQRVFIIGEKADEELMSAAAWLHDRGVDIVFVEAALGVEPMSGAEYLRCHAFNPQEARAASAVAAGQPAFKSAAPRPGQKPVEPDIDLEMAPEPDWSQLDLDDSVLESPAPEPAKPEKPKAPERRAIEREPVSADRVVEVEYAGRRLGAHLTNYSETGVGLEMNSPLPIGSTVIVIGQVEAGGESIPLRRKGRVRFCRFEEQGFRLGVAFEQV